MHRRASAGPILLLLLAVGAGGEPARGQTPTHVDVSTRIAAQRFRITFGAESRALEDSVTTRLTDRLSDRFRFLRFTGGDTAAAYRLVFTLDRRERGSVAPFPEYGFWARLERPDGTPVEIYWNTLRPAAVAPQGIGTGRDFLDDVDAMLAEPELEPLHAELLSEVPIATTTLASQAPLGWALPIPNDSLCMRKFTILEVFAVFREGSGQGVDRPDTARVVSQPFTPATPGPGQEPFLHKVFSEPISREAREELEAALARGTVEGKEVFVLDYQLDPNACRRPIGPMGPVTGGGR
ncbi:MAG: hypothetical protein PVI57_16250 [Gemmatimonadota bacterium]|jgi:hypothetical protein